MERCPYIIRKLAGDETYDICVINMKRCLIEHGLYECKIWDEYKEECEGDLYTDVLARDYGSGGDED